MEPNQLIEPLERLSSIIESFSYFFLSEYELQDSIETVLTNAGEAFEREVRLGPAGRIDFLSADGIGIELKVAGQTASVARQIDRYLGHPAITGLIVVTTRRRHASFVDMIEGKPICVVVVGPAL